VYLAPGGVVEDVQPHGPSQEFPHRPTVANIGFRYLLPILFLVRGDDRAQEVEGVRHKSMPPSTA
jgi:hypothetical protein